VQAVGDAQQWNGCHACRRIRQRCQGNLGGHTVLPGSSAQARGESDAEKVKLNEADGMRAAGRLLASRRQF
jgi:hypothetical protein